MRKSVVMSVLPTQISRNMRDTLTKENRNYLSCCPNSSIYSIQWLCNVSLCPIDRKYLYVEKDSVFFLLDNVKSIKMKQAIERGMGTFQSGVLNVYL